MSAHRHCPRIDSGTGVDNLRRARFGTGCIHSGTGHQPLDGLATTPWLDVNFHRPRSQRRPPHFNTCHGALSWASDGNCKSQ